MDHRFLGRSGLKVSTITLGTMTFGGAGDFAAVGTTDLATARRQVDIALDAGVNLIDTADVYSDGMSEEIVGQILHGRRDAALLTTKVRFGMGTGPNDEGLSRHHLIAGCEASLRRLQTDHLDLYQLHEWDGSTPLEETFAALDHLVSAGKVRYVGVSNFAGWQLMKAIGVAQRHGFPPVVSQQIHYTLQAREAEYELVPAAVDAGVGILVWSPLAGGLLSGKYRRGQQPPSGSRDLAAWGEPPVRDQELLYDIIEVLVARFLAFALALAFAVIVAPARAQSLARLHVAAFAMSIDRSSARVGEPLHLSIAARLGEPLTALDDVTLPDLAAFDELGDERRCTASTIGSTCVETIALAARRGGILTIAPAELDAIDARNGRASRFLTNAVTVRIEGGAAGDGVRDTIDDLAGVFLRGTLVVVVVLGAALALVWAIGRRRPGPAAAPALAPIEAPVDADARYRNLVRELEREPTRERARAVRDALRSRAGARDDETLGDLVSRGAIPPGARASAFALERAAFCEDERVDDAIRAVLACPA